MTANNAHQRETTPIVTEDMQIVYRGDTAYNYYDMWPCRIVTEPDEDGWFMVAPVNGFTGPQKVLNGARLCSTQYARNNGFKMLPTD